PQVQQYYKVDDIPVLAPPSLRGEGNKIQHDWLFNFFKNVEQLRPKLFAGIRMPSFPATDEEWTAIIAYFNAASNKESAKLNQELANVEKYIDDQTKVALQPVAMPSTAPSSAPSVTTKPSVDPATAQAKYDALLQRAGA